MTIVLLTEDGLHLGFLMCHFEDTRSGTCVFSIVPIQASLFEHPLALKLFRRREAGEGRFEIGGDAGTSICVESPGLPRLQIELDRQGEGTWGEGDGDLFSVLGKAKRGR